MLEAAARLQSFSAAAAELNVTHGAISHQIRSLEEHLGVGPWPGLHSERLAGDTYFLVCSPRFRRGKLPTKPSQLAGLPLFRNDPGLWEKWFAAAGVKMAVPASGIDYNDAALFLQQAIAGDGISLARRSLIGDDFANGKLVKLFDIEIKSENDYHLVCLPQNANSRKVRAFRDWIVNEIDWPQY